MRLGFVPNLEVPALSAPSSQVIGEDGCAEGLAQVLTVMMVIVPMMMMILVRTAVREGIAQVLTMMMLMMKTMISLTIMMTMY